MDSPDLAPATRKRARRPPEPVVASPPVREVSTTTAADDARLLALESSVRAIDARLELIERTVRTTGEELRRDVTSGFQEVASRSLVLAEATDELLSGHAATLARVEAALAALPESLPRPDLSGIEEAVRALASGLTGSIEAIAATTGELRTAVASIAERLAADSDDALRAEVGLVAERLSTLLGGPTLTELMDRIDELGERDPAPPKRRRLRSGE